MLADCKTVAEMMVVISVSSVAEEGGFSLQNKIQQEKLSGKILALQQPPMMHFIALNRAPSRSFEFIFACYRHSIFISLLLVTYSVCVCVLLNQTVHIGAYPNCLFAKLIEKKKPNNKKHLLDLLLVVLMCEVTVQLVFLSFNKRHCVMHLKHAPHYH